MKKIRYRALRFIVIFQIDIAVDRVQAKKKKKNKIKLGSKTFGQNALN